MHKIKAFDAYRTSVHVGVVTGGEVVIVLEGVTVDVCVQLPGDVVYEGVVIPQAVHVVSIDESNFKEGLISEAVRFTHCRAMPQSTMC